MKQIGFRVDDEQGDELQRRADLAGVSIHEIARRLALKGSEDNSDLLRLELGKVSSQVTELREDLGRVTELLLFALGKIPLEEGRELVSDLLKRGD